MTRDALLTRLLELTPPPPDPVDPDQLIAAAAAMMEARSALLATAGSVVGTAAGTLVAELAARDAAWHGALAAAQQRVGKQRMGTAKLRHYAPAGR